eukprot:CAMPEP_0194356834 /NCGR_PEP_ID=MMETSP0174-20130528/4401_1 /TAXON_ID=216777 /ORGANISM="Proboscia alata, Strain PI-D3" /LENGTH=483 /DNA_ID=CAMNT_0039126593 /DNA_START=161 /DNA_END=1612 /DNA_ORIENTATION=-
MKGILVVLSLSHINAFMAQSRPVQNSGRNFETQLSTTTQSNEAPPLTATKPRKICLMIEPTPFTHVSGYSNRFNELLRYLSKAGDNVEVVTTESDSKIKKLGMELPKEKFGFKIHHTLGFTFPLYNHIALTLDLPDLKVPKVIERLKPDLIHCTSPGFIGFAALFYSRFMKVPLVMSYHTHLPLYGRNYLPVPGIEEFAWFLLRFVHNKVDLTLVTSPQIQKELTDNGISRVDVWRKGIDTVRFNPDFKDADMRSKMTEGNPDDFLMVYVGRIGAEKRLKDIKPVLEKMPNARLCIVGTGPQAEELQEYFKGTKTHFTGQLSGDQLSQAFASADAFIMPSDSETLGFVVLESMASGVPVVGVNAGGIPSLIDDGKDSFLVEVGDTDAMVDRLTKLQNPELRSELSINARKEAERWSWEAATSVLRNIQYEKAMVNFHSRALGFGKQRTGGALKFLLLKIQGYISKLVLSIKKYLDDEGKIAPQ